MIDRRFGEQEKLLQKKQKEKKKQETSEGIECIGTDGKRDKKTKLAETVVVNGVEPIKHYSGVEEHITYTNEPKGENLAHTTPKYGTGRGLANDMIERELQRKLV